MKTLKNTGYVGWIWASVFFVFTAYASFVTADIHQFEIDPSLSSLEMTIEVTAEVEILGFPVTVPFETTGQGPGGTGTSTSMSGELTVDATATTIQVLSGSTVTLGNSGDWLPGSDYSDYGVYSTVPEPANFGYTTDMGIAYPNYIDEQYLNSAVRNMVLAVEDSSPKALVGGVFDESGTTVDCLDGQIYYQTTKTANPVTNMAGLASSPTGDSASTTGTLELETMTFPVTALMSFDLSVPGINALGIIVTYSGTIVATQIPNPDEVDYNMDLELDDMDLSLLLSDFGAADKTTRHLDALLENFGTDLSASSSPVPEPTSMLLSLLAAMGLLGLRRRKAGR